MKSSFAEYRFTFPPCPARQYDFGSGTRLTADTVAGSPDPGQSRTAESPAAVNRRSAMSDPTPLDVGLDVRKDSITVAHAHGQSADPPVYGRRERHAPGGPRHTGPATSSQDAAARVRRRSRAVRVRHGHSSRSCGRLPRRSRWPADPVTPSLGSASGCGHGVRATLDDVKRWLWPTLVPRARQARDGSQYGGAQSTDISRINRRQYWPHLGADPGVFNDRRKRKSGRIGNDFAQHLGALDDRSHINTEFTCEGRGSEPARPSSGAILCWAAWPSVYPPQVPEAHRW